MRKPPDSNQRRRLPSAASEAPAVDRLPPYDLEAERGLLGCVMLGPNETMAILTMRLKDPGAFYDLRHQTIYESFTWLYAQRRPIDVITTLGILRDSKQLDQAGGMTYLNQLADSSPSAANVEYYLRIVLEKALLRGLIRFCTDTVGEAFENVGDVGPLIDKFESGALGVRDTFSGSIASEFCDISKTIEENTENYDDAQITGTPLGLPTGYWDYDRLIGGLFDSDMIVVAARPSVGKTSLAMNIVENLAVKKTIPCGVFSLEMSSKQLVHRMSCSIANVNNQKPLQGTLDGEERGRLNAAQDVIANAEKRIVICDTGALTIEEISARARRMVMLKSIKLLMIDYLQLIPSGRRATNRQEGVSAISNGVKALAKELKIPVIVLSQLNREVDKDKQGREPRLSDLRESGSIEQDADVVVLLHPEEEDMDNQVVKVKAIIAKNRNGRTGFVNLIFRKQSTRFDNMSRTVEEEDLPK